MPDNNSDTGVFAALVLRFERFRLPRILRLKTKVDAGETLSLADISYISRSLEKTCHILPLIDRHPEYQPFAASAVQLYHHVTSRGLENEQSR